MINAQKAIDAGKNIIANKGSKLQHVITNPLSAADTEKLRMEIAERIKAEAGEALLKRFEKQAEERIAAINHTKIIEDQYRNSTQRLNNEITALGWRGNLNLGLGILTTTAGLILLGFFVIQNGSPSDQIGRFAMHFIPRISLVIFIEIFALFFLKLYKATLAEIKFFQNELTNIESRFTALRTALAGSDAQALSSVLAKLADTERNFILKKDESTVHLELQKSERAMATDISKHVAEAVAAVLKK